nr:hypothetical protein [Tanacetum cinerariifolium]
MDAPPSPNHVFNFLEDEFEEDPKEEPEEEFEDDPVEDIKEDPEEELKVKTEDDVPPPATPPVGSPITPPPYLSLHQTLRMLLLLLQMMPLRCHSLVVYMMCNVKYLEHCEKKHKAEMEANSFEISKVKKCMNEVGWDLGDEMQFSNLMKNRVTKLEDKDQEKAKEMEKMKKHLGTLETNYALVLSDRDE